MAPVLWATDPLPLPDGWGELGPVGDAMRGAVRFHAADCGVRLATIDLDGGPYAHDVRIGRVWDGRAWAWMDDWSVRDGQLLRPGREPAPVADFPGRLEVDAQGRVVARVVEGRRVEVLRRTDGSFRGMAAAGVTVELGTDAATATGGRSIAYLPGIPLPGVKTAAGTTTYTYAQGALASVKWPDGSALTIAADGTDGTGGRWRCTVASGHTTLRGGDRTWTIERTPTELRVEDPAGARMATRWAAGALTGWTDADGQKVELERGASGRIDVVRRGAERLATLRWDGPDLRALRDVLGQTWQLEHDASGVVERGDPDGRGVTRELTGGRVRVLRRGNESVTVVADALGRPTRIAVGGQGELRLDRDASGQIVKAQDPVGGVWLVERDNGRPRTVTAPDGARWELRFDAAGRLEALVGPTGARTSIARSDGRISQLTLGGRRWSWTRDPAGAVTAIRDPGGATTALGRDPAGRLVSLRGPDGVSHTLGRDTVGRLRSLDGWRFARDDAGRVTEVREATGAVGGWSRDGAGRVTGFGLGELSFELSRDAAGRVQAVRAGEGDTWRWRVERNAAGRVSAATAANGRGVALLRDAAGLVTRVIDDLGTLSLTRDLRGRVARVVAKPAAPAPERTWALGRDVVGNVVRAEVGDLGVVGADYQPGGGLTLLRLADGALVRRNLSDDAGELVAVSPDGDGLGDAHWTLDDAGRLASFGDTTLERDPSGHLTQVAGPGGWWVREIGVLRAPDGSVIRTTAAGRPLGAELPAGGAWGLTKGAVTYRWSEAGALTGLDGSAGGAGLVHDPLGRLVELMLGERGIHVEWDALGRLRRVGDTVLTGWDGLLAVGDAPRVPFGLVASARPGGAVFTDPRAQPCFVPWAGVLRPWPTGWLRALDAAELGPGGRYVLPGGVPIGRLRAVDPLSGVATSPDRWPWTAQEPELGPDAAPFAAPDDATDAFWDAAAFDGPAGWADALARLVELGVLTGQHDPAEAPGLPWLPASFAPQAPAPVAGVAGVLLDEDPVGLAILTAALEGSGLSDAALLRALIGPELAIDADAVPGISLPTPPFVGRDLAEASFRH